MLAIASPSPNLFTNSNCNALLRELQQIWSEIGETEAEKERMLLELERECLEVYRRKVEEAANAKARLIQTVAAKEAELATLVASLGELNVQSPSQTEKTKRSLKEKLAAITPIVDDLKGKKEERLKQFNEITSQIDKIMSEISGFSSIGVSSLYLEEPDLSVRKLNDYQSNLRALQKEKSDRLHKVFDFINEVHHLCRVLGLDFVQTVSDVHPSLPGVSQEQSTNISDSTLEGLEQSILKLKMDRNARVQKLKSVTASLRELWGLMDSPREERIRFAKLNAVLGLPESEINEPGILSAEMIDQVNAEVERLTKLKASRMKELVMKRRLELEEICKMTHIQPDMSTDAEKSNALIDSGLMDPSELLANIESQIARAKEVALSRKDVMDRISKWLAACDEETWLEEYSLDDNRFNAGRGAHINLKRAERARVTVTKIPGMIDALISKTLQWENEKKMMFLYDGARLVTILEDYKLTRSQKEDDKKKFKDQKKLNDMMLTEKELMYGSKPSPKKSATMRKPNGVGGYKANGCVPRTPSGRRPSDVMTPRSSAGRQNGYFSDGRRLSSGQLNFVALSKEDTMSFASISGSEPGSPPPS